MDRTETSRAQCCAGLRARRSGRTTRSHSAIRSSTDAPSEYGGAISAPPAPGSQIGPSHRLGMQVTASRRFSSTNPARRPYCVAAASPPRQLMSLGRVGVTPSKCMSIFKLSQGMIAGGMHRPLSRRTWAPQAVAETAPGVCDTNMPPMRGPMEWHGFSAGHDAGVALSSGTSL